MIGRGEGAHPLVRSSMSVCSSPGLNQLEGNHIKLATLPAAPN